VCVCMGYRPIFRLLIIPDLVTPKFCAKGKCPIITLRLFQHPTSGLPKMAAKGPQFCAGWSKSLCATVDYNTESYKFCSKCPPPVSKHLLTRWTVFTKTVFSIARSATKTKMLNMYTSMNHMLYHLLKHRDLLIILYITPIFYFFAHTRNVILIHHIFRAVD
jgi:hypothetical protein